MTLGSTLTSRNDQEEETDFFRL